MIKLYGTMCAVDFAAARGELPAQWLTAWDACHRIGKNEKAACLSLSALALLHRAGVVGTLSYGENGRPYFEERTCDFSITHTQTHVFCALTDGEEKSTRVGIDAEDLNRPDLSNIDAMVTRWFTENERESFSASPTKETFLRIWTRKEAYSKYTGEGLKALSKIDTEAFAQEGTIRFFDYRVGTILISVCAPRDVNLPQHFTF